MTLLNPWQYKSNMVVEVEKGGKYNFRMKFSYEEIFIT